MTDAMSFRAQLNAELADSGVRVSVNDMIIKALAMAIVEYPKWNTTFHEDRLEGHDSVNIGVAIALDAGLIVPALIGVHSMSLVDIANAAKDLGRRARGEGGTLTQEELTGGTFSTSNLGMFWHRYLCGDHSAAASWHSGGWRGETHARGSER